MKQCKRDILHIYDYLSWSVNKESVEYWNLHGVQCVK